MGIGGSKEGFSVFGLLSAACSTPMGRRMLRLWFLRPIVNLEVLLHSGLTCSPAARHVRACMLATCAWQSHAGRLP